MIVNYNRETFIVQATVPYWPNDVISILKSSMDIPGMSFPAGPIFTPLKTDYENYFITMFLNYHKFRH
jgi:hypothetical protein